MHPLKVNVIYSIYPCGDMYSDVQEYLATVQVSHQAPE